MKANLTTLPQKNMPSERPFFFYLTLALIFLGVWSIYNTPQLRNTTSLIPFILLMVIHIGLYWLVIPISQKKPGIVPAYLVVQSLIALSLNLISPNQALPFGLYMSLVGLTVGIYNLSRISVGLIGFYLILSLVSYSRLVGWSQSIWWLIGFIPLMAFIMIYVILYNRQTEARQQAQRLADDLERANQQMSEYAERVEALTLTNERQRIARELHDTLSQGLAGLILQLEAADAHLESERLERARQIIQQTMAQARTTLTSARSAIEDLREPSIDLVEKVNLEASRFSQSTGIPCSVRINLDDRVPDHVSEPAQRAVAEALLNIARHAQASQVQVNLTGSRDRGLKILVQDDGIGFDLGQVLGRPGHYGLLGIRERARMAGGSFKIQSQSGEGTRLELQLPFSIAETLKTTGTPGGS